MTTITLDTCIWPGCTNTADDDVDYCYDHEDMDGTCTYVSGGSYSSPPEACDNDAVPGTDRCSMHGDDTYGDDMDTHDYYND